MARSTQVDINDSALHRIVTNNWVTGTSSSGKHKRIDITVELDNEYFSAEITYALVCNGYTNYFNKKNDAIDAFNDL